MPDVNEALFDAANRNQIFLIRFGGSSAKKIIKLLDEAEEDLVGRIAARVDRLGPAARDTLGSKRLHAILEDIRKQNAELTSALMSQTRSDLIAVANQEIEIASARINEAVGVDLNNFRPPPEEVRTLVTKRGVAARTLRQWFGRLGADRLGRLESAVNLGVIEGNTLQQIVRRFRDAENVTRRSAETLVRTHVNHVGNQARQALYEANSDIVDQLRWTATLDGRTSHICRSRDGQVYELDEGPRPPAHPNCRSIMTPVLKPWKDLAKPGALKPGRGARDIDRIFNKNLKKQGFKTGEIRKIKRNTRASMDGQVPGDLSYQDWLKRQPVGFQREVLGPTKLKLFRDGNLSLDRFVDEPTGRGLTLAEIKSRNSEAWMSAGINHDN
jgi:SPP1 gp7 family putative phage head morphogenesis protein|tara:strand:- start:10166 stop:11320 length:1155 start_codon:yes stop_codon:yes gene_type:complete